MKKHDYSQTRILENFSWKIHICCLNGPWKKNPLKFLDWPVWTNEKYTFITLGILEKNLWKSNFGHWQISSVKKSYLKPAWSLKKIFKNFSFIAKMVLEKNILKILICSPNRPWFFLNTWSIAQIVFEKIF